jgi:hypothetical protein
MQKVFNYLKSKGFSSLIIAIFVCAILAGTFSLGAMVGARKAKFTFSWGENYNRNFGGPNAGYFRGFIDEVKGNNMIEGHGAFGKIIKIDGQSLIIQGKDNIERVIITDRDNLIRKADDVIKFNDMNINDMAVVIGNPDDSGQIRAKFIRIMPPLPTMTSEPIIKP